MTDPTLVAIAAFTLGAGLSMYAVFAGADFGGGVWDLFATGERKGEQRGAIADGKIKEFQVTIAVGGRMD